jgi:hypothetical protein
MPLSGAELSREAVPRLSAIIAIYGRQTDRAELLELMADKDSGFEESVTTLKEIGRDALGEMTDEQIIGSVSPTVKALNLRWQIPRDTPREVRQQLIHDERRAAVVERWPSLPRPALGGKTPREAAGDPQCRIPLMAAVLILEQGFVADRDFEVIAELRRELGLPQPEAIEPGEEPVGGIPLVRVPRLNLALVSDDDLVQLYRRSLLASAQTATARVAREAIRRPSLADRIAPSEAYQRLIAAERDHHRALELVEEARKWSRSAGESTARWDLAELELHIANGDSEQVKQTLEQIERDHRDDPQVIAALYQLLYETGLIGAGATAMADSVDEELPTAAAVGSADPAASRIWTPDSERPSGAKSALWTPS